MPALYEIRYLPDGPARRFCGSRGNYYEFDDGSHLDMQTTPIWCRSCNDITDGEEIESLAEIDQKLADLHDPTSEAFRFFEICTPPELQELCPPDSSRLRFIEGLKKRRQWRIRRASPPKCIHCGSADIFVFPINEPVADPAGPGMVEVSTVGMCSTSFNEWFFTPEGDRIPRDTKPTYWHHPDLDRDKE